MMVRMLYSFVTLCCLAQAVCGSGFSEWNKILATVELQANLSSVEPIEIAVAGRTVVVDIKDTAICKSFSVGELYTGGENVATEYKLSAGVRQVTFLCTVGVDVKSNLGDRSGVIQAQSKGEGVSVSTVLLINSEDLVTKGPQSVKIDPNLACQDAVQVEGFQLSGKDLLVAGILDLTSILLETLTPIIQGIVQQLLCDSIGQAVPSLTPLLTDNVLTKAGPAPEPPIADWAVQVEAERFSDPEIELFTWDMVPNYTQAVHEWVGELGDISVGFGNLTIEELYVLLQSGVIQIPNLGSIRITGLDLTLEELAALPVKDLLALANVTLPTWMSIDLSVSEWLELSNLLVSQQLNVSYVYDTLSPYIQIDVVDLLNAENSTFAQLLGKLGSSNYSAPDWDSILAGLNTTFLNDIYLPGLNISYLVFLENAVLPPFLETGFSLPEIYTNWTGFKALFPQLVSDIVDASISFITETYGVLPSWIANYTQGEGPFSNATNPWANITFSEDIWDLVYILTGLDVPGLLTGSKVDFSPLLNIIFPQGIPVSLGSLGTIWLRTLQFQTTATPQATEMKGIQPAGEHTMLMPSFGLDEMGATFDLGFSADLNVNLTGSIVNLNFTEDLTMAASWKGLSLETAFLFGFHTAAVEALDLEQPDFLQCALYSVYTNLTAAVMGTDSMQVSITPGNDGLINLMSSTMRIFFDLYGGLLPNALKKSTTDSMVAYEVIPSGECKPPLPPTVPPIPSLQPSASPNTGPGLGNDPDDDDDPNSGNTVDGANSSDGASVGLVVGASIGGVAAVALIAAAAFVIKGKMAAASAAAASTVNDAIPVGKEIDEKL